MRLKLARSLRSFAAMRNPLMPIESCPVAALELLGELARRVTDA
jgi:hypothetical protein